MNLQSIFHYKSWDNFKNEAPFLAGPWNMRNIEIRSWYVSSDKFQIIFSVNIPKFEYFAWEMPVKESEFPEIRTWLRNYIPAIWKNLLLEKEDGTFKDNSGNQLGSTWCS